MEKTTIPAPTLSPTIRPPFQFQNSVTIPIAIITAVLSGVIGYKLIQPCVSGKRAITNFNVALFLTFIWGILRTSLFVCYSKYYHVADALSVIFGFSLVLNSDWGIRIVVYSSSLLAIRCF